LKRLVIKHGDRILRHELGGEPVTLGRDPSCSLSFDDPAISRKHGAFEPNASGVRFRDLGSRNGSWVNAKKMREADLKPGDTVRMGSLVITYLFESDEKTDEDATVIVSKSNAPASRPPVATPPAPVATPPRPPVATPPRPPVAPPAAPPVPPAPAQKPETDKTVLIARGQPPPDTGTLLFRAEAPKPKAVTNDTGRLSETALRPSQAPPPLAPGTAAPEEAAPVSAPPARSSSSSWTSRNALVTFGVAVVVYLVLAIPLVRTLGNALREESLRRGRVLLELLASTNALAVGEGRARDLDVSPVTREERVKEALLLDLTGKVLAPSARIDETLAAVEGIEAKTEEIRTFYLGRRSSGDYVMVAPVLHQGRRAGVAVLVYEAASASGSFSVAVMFLGFLVLLLGVAVSIVLGKRFTLEPLANLKDDVEAVVKGDAREVPLAQGFSELSDVAVSINRLIERREPAATPSFAAAPRRIEPEPIRKPPSPAMREPRPPSPGFGEARRSADVASGPPPVPSPPATDSGASGKEARFWTDANFIVVRAEPEASALFGSSPDTIEGRHIIEAVKDQKLLEVVLDAINSLDSDAGASLSAALPAGAVSVKAAREGDWVVVSLKQNT
jgi:pSer/pThr/pTyr-binding forkhead associated (FHA) protein